ncbi:hypothetical protein, partial [Glycomyces tenuis]
LDRVLEQLPTADTLRLHAPEERPAPSWLERLRARRLQYALMSATAALLVTVGAVAAAVQVVSTAGGSGDAGVIAEENAGGAPEQSGAEQEDAGAPETAEEDELAAEGEPEEQGTEGVDESGSVEVFATGTDYSSGSDVLTALRELGVESPSGTVPEELAGLAEGGVLWENCQEAIALRYDSLIVAADFARFETQPAVVALLVSDSGEMAVALTPDCGNGHIGELFVQE